MAIPIKNNEELELMRESALILGKCHGEVAKLVKPGVKTSKLDEIAEEFIKDHGGKPSFKGYGGFPYTLCISPNDVVVHGFPSDREVQEGEILSIDCGVFYKGFHSDSAYTYPVGKIDVETENLLKATKESLYEAIKATKVGNRVEDIGYTVQTYVEKRGYSVPREVVGHGVGRNLHEDPQVPNYGKRGRGKMLKNGMVLAIEPMVNKGTRKIYTEKDGWTIRTKDHEASAHFEHTVAIIDGLGVPLTTFKYIEEALNKYGKTSLN